MESTTIPLQNVVASLGMVEIDTTKIYKDKYINLSFLYSNQMPLSRMSILTKCRPVMRVTWGLHTVMWDGQGLSTIIERSIIGGGLYCC